MAYHHGHLARALIEAGLEVTRTDGPAALTIREVTRRTGVTPNAAYRHFPDRRSLLHSVSEVIEERMASAMTGFSPTSSPRDQLRTIGLAYIGFALAEPGWFAVTFFGEGVPAAQDVAASPPYRALTDALQRLIDAGELAPAARPFATWACWSAVHGFAELALHGPLHHVDRAELWEHAERTVDAIINGITA
ncbi:MAG TPA: TetR/AcrR family transcriptional regulator [Mycobacterium sp.]